MKVGHCITNHWAREPTVGMSPKDARLGEEAKPTKCHNQLIPVAHGPAFSTCHVQVNATVGLIDAAPSLLLFLSM